MATNNFFPKKSESIPMIYAYEDKHDPNLKSILKVGYTTIGVQERVRQQYNIMRPGEPPYRILVEESAMRKVYQQQTDKAKAETPQGPSRQRPRRDGSLRLRRKDHDRKPVRRRTLQTPSFRFRYTPGRDSAGCRSQWCRRYPDLNRPRCRAQRPRPHNSFCLLRTQRN